MLNMTSKKNAARAAVVAALVLCGAASARADVVLDWNATMLATLAGQTPSPRPGMQRSCTWPCFKR